MNKPRTLPVVVHKAAVPLLKGESLNQFTCAVNDAASVYIKQKYNLPSGDCDSWVWCHEVYADKAVCSVSNYKAETQKDRHFYVAIKFTRRDSGDFDVTESMKVRPVMSFVADKEMSVTKDKAVKKAYDMENWSPGESLFKGAV